MTVITFTLEEMNPVQLARLYRLLVSLYRLDEAEQVYQAGLANCGPQAFCEEVARA